MKASTGDVQVEARRLLHEAIQTLISDSRGFNERKQEMWCRYCRFKDPLHMKLHDPDCPIYLLHGAWERACEVGALLAAHEAALSPEQVTFSRALVRRIAAYVRGYYVPPPSGSVPGAWGLLREVADMIEAQEHALIQSTPWAQEAAPSACAEGSTQPIPIDRVREVSGAFMEGYTAGFADAENGMADDREDAWAVSKASAGLLADRTEGNEPPAQEGSSR